jgi:adenosylhomocysteine nucleosidase
VGNVERSTDVGSPRILVVTGFGAEARIAGNRQVRTVCGAGNKARLEAALAALRESILGIISFGVAGGLSPEMTSGTVIVAQTVISTNERYAVDPVWLDRLATRLPQASRAAIVGVDVPVGNAREKAQLGAETGAAVVDTESHIAARFAASYACPFAAVRIVLDPVQLTLPPAALVGLDSDGEIDVAAVLRTLARAPFQLPALLQAAIAARRAFATLRHSRHLLDEHFCFPTRRT